MLNTNDEKSCQLITRGGILSLVVHVAEAYFLFSLAILHIKEFTHTHTHTFICIYIYIYIYIYILT